MNPARASYNIGCIGAVLAVAATPRIASQKKKPPSLGKGYTESLILVLRARLEPSPRELDPVAVGRLPITDRKRDDLPQFALSRSNTWHAPKAEGIHKRVDSRICG